jgi:hypothetical protein
MILRALLSGVAPTGPAKMALPLAAIKKPRKNILCIQTQPLAHARGSACAFDRAGPRGHPVRERLRTFETFGQLIVSRALTAQITSGRSVLPMGRVRIYIELVVDLGRAGGDRGGN